MKYGIGPYFPMAMTIHGQLPIRLSVEVLKIERVHFFKFDQYKFL